MMPPSHSTSLLTRLATPSALGRLALLAGVLPGVLSIAGCNDASSNALAASVGSKPPVPLAAPLPLPPVTSRSASPHLSNPAMFRPFDGSIKECDVLVIGGTPAGIAAALAAARRGAKVVLVENRPHLGGDIVYQMLNMWDVPLRPGSASPVVQGIFAEFFDQLGIAFNIERAMRTFESTVAAEPTLHTFVETRVGHVFRDGTRVTGAVLRGRNGPEYTIRASAVVDATNDASFTARAGGGYFLGRQKTNPDKAMQSAGLLFSVAGADWKKIRSYVSGTKIVKLTPEEVRRKRFAIDLKTLPGHGGLLRKQRMGGGIGNYLFERGDIVQNYKPRGRDIVMLSINFGRQNDGTIVLNTLNIYGVNGLSATSVAQGMAQARAELPHFMEHLRKTMPGFKKAKLAAIAPELYIRETRHIQGLYMLTAEDIVQHKRFSDRIAIASYPLDLHPYKRGEINPLAPQRYNYTVPLRCMIPTRVDGVFVASRSLSATSAAAGSARVLPITMAVGEAAGAASWLCARSKITPHQMAGDPRYVAQLQDTLRAWGADIGDKFPGRTPPGPVIRSHPPQKTGKPVALKTVQPTSTSKAKQIIASLLVYLLSL